MDKLQFHYSSSIFKDSPYKNFLDPSISWKNKYKDNDLKKSEKFPGSTTIFVAFTDAWHLMQMVFLTSLFAAITLHTPLGSPLIDFLLLRLVFGIVFETTFTNILHEENTNIIDRT